MWTSYVSEISANMWYFMLQHSQNIAYSTLKRSNWTHNVTPLTWSGQLLLYNHLWPFSAQSVGVFDWWWDVWRSEAIHPLLWHSSQRANLGLIKKTAFLISHLLNSCFSSVSSMHPLTSQTCDLCHSSNRGLFICFAYLWWCAIFFLIIMC